MPKQYDRDPCLPTPDGRFKEILQPQAGIYFHDMLIALGQRPILERITEEGTITQTALMNEQIAKLQNQGEPLANTIAGNKVNRAMLHLRPRIVTGEYGQGKVEVTPYGRTIHNFLTDVIAQSPVPKDRLTSIFSAINPRFGVRRERSASHEEKPISSIRVLWYFLFNNAATTIQLREVLHLSSTNQVTEVFRQFPNLFTRSNQPDHGTQMLELTEEGKVIRDTVLLHLWREAQKATAYY